MKLFLHASMGMAAIVTLVWTEQATASTIVQDRRPPAFTLVQGVTPRPSCQMHCTAACPAVDPGRRCMSRCIGRCIRARKWK